MVKAALRGQGLVAAVAALVVAFVVSAMAPASASAQGRTIEADFCLSQHLFCMSAGLSGQSPVEGYGVDGNGGICHKPPDTTDPLGGPEYCVPSGTGLLMLRPGQYWLSAFDDQNKHNFSLRSCPGSTTPCTSTNPNATAEYAITDIATVYSDPVTITVNLKPGWYRIFCDSDSPVVHETAGMYVDFEVTGVGQARPI
jgi:hypothetical protein